MNRIKADVSGSNEGSPLGLYSVCACTPDGRRFWYCYPDGKPRNGIYLRELTESQLMFLCDSVRQAGGIDVDKACWQEGDPIYGSVAYQQSGLEMQWLERERADGDYFGVADSSRERWAFTCYD